MELTIRNTRLTLTRGDITTQEVDALVNAANVGLLGGGGVDGAIHRAGGPQIMDECRAIRAAQGGCPPGHAVVTSGGRLKARHVIHTVGPVWHGGTHDEDAVLARAYRSSLDLALHHRIRTLAFPCISAGAYGFPPERAARIAFDTVCDFVRTHEGLDEVRFVVFGPDDLERYRTLFLQTGPGPASRF